MDTLVVPVCNAKLRRDVQVNTDKNAPIGDVADVLVVADVTQFVPMLTEKISAM